MNILSRISLLFLLFIPPYQLLAVEDAGDDTPLPPDVAFKQKVSLKDSQTIQANWTIENKYYMYRNKFKFISKTKGIELGPARIPPGKKKKDPLFGIVNIFRNNVSIQIPIKRIDKSITELSVEVHSQGCADIGICYPPQKKIVKLTLAVLAAPTTSSTTTDSSNTSNTKTDNKQINKSVTAAKDIQNFGNALGLGQADDYLEVDKAFQLDTEYNGSNMIIARWKVADAYYLYKKQFKFTLINAPPGVTLGTPQIPTGKLKKDPAFGDVYVFYKYVEIKIPVKGAKKGQKLKLIIRSQGCADAGLCYPPVTQIATYTSGQAISVKNYSPSSTTQTPKPSATSKKTNPAISIIEDDQSFFEKLGDWFTKALNGGNIFIALMSMLGLGLLVAFTACMYPMIPIVCALVIGEGKTVTKYRGFVMSSTYVLSMALVFGILGGVVGYLGESSGISFAAAAQNPLIILFVVSIMVLLALGMFGVFNIQMPSFLQNKLDAANRSQKGGTLMGAAATGAISALVVGPCGGPFLLAALGYATTSGNMFNGFLYLFLFGLGMGLPLIIVGIYGSSILPRAGNWMSMVKNTGGIILLALALYFAERLTDQMPGLFMMLWALLFIMTGIYFRALEPVPTGASGKRYMLKGVAVIIFLWGILVAIGGLTGAIIASDPFEGSSLTNGGSTRTTSHNNTNPRKQAYLADKKVKTKGSLKFITIKSKADLLHEIKQANAAGFNVMLDFYATWCTYCIQFDVYVFKKPEVVAALSNTILLEADVTANDKTDKELMKYIKIFAPPAIIFYGKNGQEVGKRVYKFVKKKRFLKRVKGAFGSNQ